MLAFAATPANAATGAQDGDSTVDAGSLRVFYLTSEKMPIGAPDTTALKSSGDTVGVYTPVALPGGVKLAVGETAKLIYSDGVVVQTGWLYKRPSRLHALPHRPSVTHSRAVARQG
jgi:hypothetical protein